MMNLLEEILRRREELRPAEQKVADVILASPEEVLDLNMAGLAAAASTSEPTVMRFCRAVGFDGFSVFKIALIRAVALGQPSPSTLIRTDDAVSDMIDKVFNRSIEGIERTRTMLNRAAIAEAVDLIVAANELLMLGAGTSGLVAQDAQQKYPIFGRPCQAPLDNHMQFMAASFSSPSTVTIAISNSGRSHTVIDAAKAAQKAGSKVIAITGGDSPLSRLADVDIRTSTFEDTEASTPMVSRLAALVIIDVLATGVALRSDEASLERILAMKEGLIHRQERPEIGEVSRSKRGSRERTDGQLADDLEGKPRKSGTRKGD